MNVVGRIIDFLFGGFVPIIILLGIIILASLKQINQYERGVKFTMGRFTTIVEPGWRIILPVFQSMKKVDIRTKAVEVPDQEAMTKDNIQTTISAVVYYKVVDAAKSILEVENFFWAVSQLAQTSMRNVIGEVALDDLLTQRNVVAERIKNLVDESTEEWGIDIISVELKDIKVPESMIRTMAKQAEAEREKKATIIASEGEVIAAVNLAKAARTMAEVPGALHLRTLNSINDISSDQSNTIIFAVPLEVLRAVEGLGKKFLKSEKSE
ncbi:MAG: slipin family protein [Candidatus Humimicrobiia bacterium]